MYDVDLQLRILHLTALSFITYSPENALPWYKISGERVFNGKFNKDLTLVACGFADLLSLCIPQPTVVNFLSVEVYLNIAVGTAR